MESRVNCRTANLRTQPKSAAAERYYLQSPMLPRQEFYISHPWVLWSSPIAEMFWNQSLQHSSSKQQRQIAAEAALLRGAPATAAAGTRCAPRTFNPRCQAHRSLFLEVISLLLHACYQQVGQHFLSSAARMLSEILTATEIFSSSWQCPCQITSSTKTHTHTHTGAYLKPVSDTMTTNHIFSFTKSFFFGVKNTQETSLAAHGKGVCAF